MQEALHWYQKYFSSEPLQVSLVSLGLWQGQSMLQNPLRLKPQPQAGNEADLARVSTLFPHQISSFEKTVVV